MPIPEEYQDKFLDVGTYPNINDLFYITDLLITDYSSNIFEYSLMRKPMMFFAFDKVQYSFSRGFHRDYEESAPGKICYTFDELMDAFAAQDFEYEKVEEYVRNTSIISTPIPLTASLTGSFWTRFRKNSGMR